MKYLLVVALISFNSFAGNEKGNGGDTVRCLGKLRTLDSVLMASEGYYELRSNEKTADSIRMIKNHLGETLPLMSQNLEMFLEAYHSKKSPKGEIFWISGRPIDVKDENLFVAIPKECSDMKQAVVLVKTPIRRYYYDQKILTELENESNELSWLLIHEWLRSYVDDSDTIRIINAYLHSVEFISEDEITVEDTLKNLGISSGMGLKKSYVTELEKNIKIQIEKAQSHIEDAQKALELKNKTNVALTKEKLQKKAVLHFNSARAVLSKFPERGGISLRLESQYQKISIEINALEQSI